MSEMPQPENNFDEFEESPGSRPTPPAGRNRTFLIAIGIIGAIFVIALIFLLVTLVIRAPQQASQAREQADKINAQNTMVAATATADQMRVVQLQQTLDAAAKAPPPTATSTPVVATATSVVAIPTATATPTATVSAADLTKTASVKTQIAQGTKVGSGGAAGYPAPGTPTGGTPQPTPTGLPTTGFMDEVGMPGLLGAAGLLLVVIFLARRARLAH